LEQQLSQPWGEGRAIFHIKKRGVLNTMFGSAKINLSPQVRELKQELDEFEEYNIPF
jgi:hypothetical protein